MDKIQSELAGWKARILSFAGNTFLIKSNLSGVSQHSMN